MRFSRMTAAIGFVLLVAAITAPGAGGQDAGPGELWQAFPLEPTTSAPSSPEAPAAEAPPVVAADAAGSDSDGGLPSWTPAALAAAIAVVGLTVLVVMLRADRRRGSPLPPVGAESAHPTPPPPPPPTADPEPPPAPPATAGRADALGLARLAADYLAVVDSGSRRPVLDLAEARSWDLARARREMARARSRGMLISAGRGQLGGALSAQAQRLLGASAPVAEVNDERRPQPALPGRADLVVHEPASRNGRAGEG